MGTIYDGMTTYIKEAQLTTFSVVEEKAHCDRKVGLHLTSAVVGMDLQGRMARIRSKKAYFLLCTAFLSL